MPITCTTVAGATVETSLFKKNVATKLNKLFDYKSFQVSCDIYQRALGYNSNTIVTYPKTPNTTIYARCHIHFYKSYYNIATGLFSHYKIPKAAAMRLSK